MQVSIEHNINSHNHTTVSFFTPLKLRRRGGHRMIVLPEDSDNPANNVNIQPDIDEKLLKTLVKATAWEKQLRAGKLTLKEITLRESVSERYIQHILRLNFFAPDLKEAILEGRQPERLSVDRLRLSMPLVWEEQKKLFSLTL